VFQPLRAAGDTTGAAAKVVPPGVERHAEDMTEEKKPFTVSDRRHFTSEGETRREVAEEEPATPAPPPPSRPPVPERAAPSLPVPSDEMPEPMPGEEGAAPMDFVGLLVSLASQASFLIAPDPGSGAAPDLAGARSIIGLLEVLKQKTEGRRTPEEERVLDGLLYELRMAFVSRARSEKA
jgi:hypothetical protein